MFHLFFCPQIHHHMISAIGLAQGIIEFCYLLLVLFPVGKLDPQFPSRIIKRIDFFTDLPLDEYIDIAKEVSEIGKENKLRTGA